MADPNFERMLRAAAGRGRPVGDHPDAALLAAYVDRSVSDAERAELEAHVASCTACMEHLGLLANVNVPDEPSAPVAWAAPVWLTRFGWLVPIATAVLVVAIWVRQPAPSPAPAITQSPAAPPIGQSASNELKKSPDEPEFRARTSASPPEPLPAEKTLPKAKADGARKQPAGFQDAARQEAARAAGGGTSIDSLRERDLKALDANKPAAANTAAAPVPPAAAAAPAAQAEAVASAGGRADEAAAVKNIREAGAARAKEEKDEFAQGMLQKAASDAPVVLATGPGVIVRRVGARLERSTDSGTTWTEDLTAAPAALRLGTCPTSEVCWLGGASGLVLRRDASGTWTRHVVADGRAAIIGLEASDALTATARLSDGRQFATTDGGVTWNKQ